MKFNAFARQIHARLVALSSGELFTIDGDVWAEYLKSYPEGSNPVYKTRTEHDCSCCKQFVRNFGNVVAIVDGKIQTIWDAPDLESPYKEVASHMDFWVKDRDINSLFRKNEWKYGTESTNQLLEDGTVKKWNHFHGVLAQRHFASSVGEVCGKFDTDRGVFKRGLEELEPGAFTDIIDLIGENGLYRGAEHLSALQAFQKFQNEYNDLGSDEQRDLYIWSHTGVIGGLTHFKNSVIGTLVADVSDGTDIEDAVRKFEAKVAPTNYKRPTALITPRMVEDAMKTINELNLLPALDRRFAKASDMRVVNTHWVDNDIIKGMKSSVEKLLIDAAVAPKAPTLERTAISIEDFMRDVVPTATSMELFVKGTMVNSFMSLTAPVHEDSAELFKWSNSFGWSYDGNITDSIKERVKAAGGNVTNAKMRVSLSWSNFDDLDLHVYEPNGTHIYFGNKCGKLDVDMNAGRGTTRAPVENVSWTSMTDGLYTIAVNQYMMRETTAVGFTVEIENNGALYQYSYPKALNGSGNSVVVAILTVKDGAIVKIEPAKDIVGGGMSSEKWGVTTERLAKVNMLMNSPNHWDDNTVGNKHWFFILEGCRNPESTRGIYNEFLSNSLDKHRKVFEVLGNKTKCPVAIEQLSGLGFSAAKDEKALIAVTVGKARRSYQVVF
jgi:hypothetical protein